MKTETTLPALTAPSTGLAPSGSQILRAGVSGAAIAATWTGIYEIMRVRAGETTPQEAMRATASSALIGAGAGAITNVVANVARSVPILGLAALAVGALYFASKSKRAAETKK